jgi:endonuclease YncB( thermonuclease family)
MPTILSLIFSKVGFYAAVVLAIFIAGVVLCWKWDHRGEGKTYTEVLTVASVANGATIEAKAGLLGRATRPVFIAGIAAPGLNDPLGAASRDNLAGLAGETIRVQSETRGILGKPLVGQVFGDTGADLGIAQLRAGLAKCESQATKEQIAAQKEAQKAARGLWETSGGSHWWHFSVADGTIPEPIPLVPESDMPALDFGLILEIAVLAIATVWVFWYFFGAAITAKFSAATAVTSAVDTSEQLAAYAALTLIRYSSPVVDNPNAVASCESLRGVVTAWKLPAASASTPATPAISVKSF